MVEIDNDVNWAALAERVQGNATDLDDFVLCYLGEGVGGAVVIDGSVVGVVAVGPASWLTRVRPDRADAA